MKECTHDVSLTRNTNAALHKYVYRQTVCSGEMGNVYITLRQI